VGSAEAARSSAAVSYRSRDQILRMFGGFDLVEPGLTAVTQWRGGALDDKLDAARQWWPGGAGRKP
jgi:S-adenosyl methyltransferase